MIKVAGGLPVKTRLPIAAWVLAGLVTLLSLVQVNLGADHSAVFANKPTNEPYYASATDLLGVLRPL
jgi:hypothetical protein